MQPCYLYFPLIKQNQKYELFHSNQPGVRTKASRKSNEAAWGKNPGPGKQLIPKNSKLCSSKYSLFKLWCLLWK